MMRSLSTREQRLVALLVLVALVALAYFAVLAPLFGGFAERAAQREQLARQYQGNLRKVAAIPRLRRLAATRIAAGADYALRAADSAEAGEILRARVQTAALAAGGEFLSGEDVAAPAQTAVVRVTLRLTYAALLQLIETLENSRPYLTITSLAIGSDEALVSGQGSKLDVQLELSIPFKPAAAR